MSYRHDRRRKDIRNPRPRPTLGPGGKVYAAPLGTPVTAGGFDSPPWVQIGVTV
jgi:hypothetical protein